MKRRRGQCEVRDYHLADNSGASLPACLPADTRRRPTAPVVGALIAYRLIGDAVSSGPESGFRRSNGWNLRELASRTAGPFAYASRPSSH